METFIRSDQYNFISEQVQTLVNGHAAVNDSDVLVALRSLAIEKVRDLFPDLEERQRRIINSVTKMEDRLDAEMFLAQLKPYVIPFPEVTEAKLAELFPKAKKLKLPRLNEIDSKETSYLSWIDKGSHKKFIVAPYQDQLVGIQGSFSPSRHKGICKLCNSYQDVGLFVTDEKAKGQGTFVKRGDYICRDSRTCNYHITTIKHLEKFIERVNQD